MDITVNGKESGLTINDPKTIGELVSTLVMEVSKNDQVITNLKINDIEIPIQASMQTVENLDPSCTVVIETSNPRLLALEALSMMPDFASSREESLTEIVDMLRTQKVIDAMELFSPVIDDFKWLSVVLSSMDAVLGLDLSVLELSDAVVSDKRDKLFFVFQEILDSLEMEDYILLADLLEYELKEELAYWREIAPVLLLMAQRPSN